MEIIFEEVQQYLNKFQKTEKNVSQAFLLAEMNKQDCLFYNKSAAEKVEIL